MTPDQTKLFTYMTSQSPLSHDTISGIVQLYKTKQFKKGDAFATQGELSDQIGFICSGIFRMFVLNEDGSVFTKLFMMENEFLLATFDIADISTISIEAVIDSTILTAPYDQIQHQFELYPRFNVFARKEIESILSVTYARYEQLATLDAGQRYLMFLEKYPHLRNQLPQYMIASYLGITPTQLSRIRKKMVNPGQ